MTRDVASPEAARLDEALNARRLETPGLKWTDWAARARDAGYRLSSETLRAVRRGDYPPTPEVAAAIEFMAGWGPGSVRNVMGGKPPIPLESSEPDAKRQPPKYDDPALQAIWEIDLLDKEEREAAIFAVGIIRDRKRGAETAHAARA